MLDTFSIFAIFRKIFVVIHRNTLLIHAMNAACPSLHSDFFSNFFVKKIVLKRIFKFSTFLDTTVLIFYRYRDLLSS